MPSVVGDVEQEVEEVVEEQVVEGLVEIVQVVVLEVKHREVAVVERSMDENLAQTRSRS